MHLYIDFLLELVTWTRVSKPGVNIALRTIKQFVLLPFFCVFLVNLLYKVFIDVMGCVCVSQWIPPTHWLPTGFIANVLSFSLCVSVCVLVSFMTVCLCFWLFPFFSFLFCCCHIWPVASFAVHVVFEHASCLVSLSHTIHAAFLLFLSLCFKCLSLCQTVCSCLSFCLFPSPSFFSLCLRLHNVPSSSLCDFAERGPGSGCHPLPPPQHCPRTPDQRGPAAHRLPALPHQPASHLHRAAVRGAGALVRKHWTLLPGVQWANGPLQRIWVCRIHEEGLCFPGPFWASGSAYGTLKCALGVQVKWNGKNLVLLKWKPFLFQPSIWYAQNFCSKNAYFSLRAAINWWFWNEIQGKQHM